MKKRFAVIAAGLAAMPAIPSLAGTTTLEQPGRYSANEKLCYRVRMGTPVWTIKDNREFGLRRLAVVTNPSQFDKIKLVRNNCSVSVVHAPATASNIATTNLAQTDTRIESDQRMHIKSTGEAYMMAQCTYTLTGETTNTKAIKMRWRAGDVWNHSLNRWTGWDKWIRGHQLLRGSCATADAGGGVRIFYEGDQSNASRTKTWEGDAIKPAWFVTTVAPKRTVFTYPDTLRLQVGETGEILSVSGTGGRFRLRSTVNGTVRLGSTKVNQNEWTNINPGTKAVFHADGSYGYGVTKGRIEMDLSLN